MGYSEAKQLTVWNRTKPVWSKYEKMTTCLDLSKFSTTLLFTNRTKMEGHAIHSKSCLHFQQDEEYVCADNRVWKTSGWLLGGMYQGQKHGSGRLQDRERQVLSYHNVFSKCCSNPSLTCWHSHVHTKHTQYYTTFPLHILITHVILVGQKRDVKHPGF